MYVNLEEKSMVTLGNAIVYDFTKSRTKIFMADIRHASYYTLHRVNFSFCYNGICSCYFALHYSKLRTACFYTSFFSPQGMPVRSLTNLHGTIMIWGHSVHSGVNKIHSSSSHEITFDTHVYNTKIGHLIVDIIH